MSYAFYIISTPCPFTNSFKSDSISIMQVTSNEGDARYFGHPGPFEHHFYALSIPLIVSEDSLGTLLRWPIDPENVLAVLSLYYGKRVLNHGQISSPMSMALPDLQSARPNPYYSLPIYSGPRTTSTAVSTDWTMLGGIRGTLQDLATPNDLLTKLLKGARPYADSLRLFPFDRELAYFRLIQALEAMYDKSELSDKDLFSHDKELMGHLQWLDQLGDPHGRSTANFLRSRLYQIKRGVWLWLSKRLDQPYYDEGPQELTPDNIQQTLSAAYDLRSMYAHAGIQFGDWIDPTDGRCGLHETVPEYFAAICDDKDLCKLLKKCPSYLGLERLVRYALSRELMDVCAKG